MTGRIAMTAPDFYEVAYRINPWMRPEEWGGEASERAKSQWSALAFRLRGTGMTVEVIPGAPGLPDLVFPANSAIVLDGRMLLARFRHPERRGEEIHFRRFFETLTVRGILSEIGTLPESVFQEGAGDCLWDAARRMFWAAWGPRSSEAALSHIAEFFGQRVAGLELVTERFYHLDTCFNVLPGGEILYFPPALSARSQAVVAEHVPAAMRIEAMPEEAAAFSLNAVGIGRDLLMAEPPPRLRQILEERGYRCIGLDLSSFILSGGGSFCMTLRLDLTSGTERKGTP